MALVMYDLDGTLLDTAAEITDAVNLTLQEFDHDLVSEEQVRCWIGQGTGWLMETAWKATAGPTETSWGEVMARFIYHYEATAGTSSTFFPHVLDTLQKARDYGVKQALVTNKERRFTDRVLQKHGLTGAFDLIICGDSLKVKKPHPDVIHHCLKALDETAGSSLFVGDSETDISTAKAAGVMCWAVPYGYNHGRPINESMPDRVVPDIRDVPNYFRHM
jgi:phosphoglycolate phosphatase